MEGTIEALIQQARNSLNGQAGERRVMELEAFLREMLAEYSAALGVGQRELLAALEKSRRSQATGYYQRTNFPRLETVTLLADMREFKKRYPSGCFRCPSCRGISTNPTQCNSGLETGDGDARRRCDRRAYKAAQPGEIMRVVFRDGFLDKPAVFEVFMPLEAEGPNHGAPPAWPT